MARTYRRLDLADPNWEPWDPKGREVGPREYPDDLVGFVDWAHKFTEGDVPLVNGSMGLSVVHMEGTPTEWHDRERTETEIIVLLEGAAEMEPEPGVIEEIKAPAVIMFLPGHRDRWHYSKPYRGLYVVIW